MSEPTKEELLWRPGRVPCGGCVKCCRNDLIFLHPEFGDNPEEYETEITNERHVLKHKESGDCFYLGINDDGGSVCTIWDKRPVICREFDCRTLYLSTTKKQRQKFMNYGIVKKCVFNMGKKLQFTLPVSDRQAARAKREP